MCRPVRSISILCSRSPAPKPISFFCHKGLGAALIEQDKTIQQIVNNSRFLVLAPIKNLASLMLSCTLRELKKDWERQYAIEPLLVETLVDRQRFHGGCYRASNWIELGETTGRGRSDKTNTPNKALAKTIFVYPLVKNAIYQLKEGSISL